MGYTGEVACEQALYLEEIGKSTRASGTRVTPLAASPLARVAGFARPNGELSRMLQGKGMQKGPFNTFDTHCSNCAIFKGL